MPLNKDIDNILNPLLGAFDERLTATVDGQLAEVYVSGQAEMITWGKTKAGVPIAFEGPPIKQAIDWAEKQGAQLVTQMDTETKRRLAKTVSDAIANKRGVPGLARDIKGTFADMTKFRSELIARTETANALSQASLDNMEAMGIEGKEWVTAGDDLVSDECQANEAEGAIPRNQVFSGGTSAPPQHPDCRCALAPAILPKAPEKPAIAPPTKAMPTAGDSPEMKNLVDNKLKVTGKKQGDIEGLQSTLKELRSVNLPESHLASVRSIEINAAKVQRVRGALAYVDGSNNIVLAGKVAKDNVVHEVGHAFFQKNILRSADPRKWDIADAFNASTKTGKGFVSAYARADVDEFFAEAYAAFAKDPKALTKLNPTMGKLLKGYWK